MPKNKATDPDVEAAESVAIQATLLGFNPDPAMARGDARDAMLNVIRAAVDWSKFNEQQQRDINAAVNNAAETIVAKLVAALSAEGRDTVQAKVEQVAIKDGLKITLSAIHDHDSVVILGDLVGKQVTLTSADIGGYCGQRGDARVDRDQPDMLEDGQPQADDAVLAGDDLVNSGDEATDELVEEATEAEPA